MAARSVAVTIEDRDKIVEFSKGTARVTDLEAEIKDLNKEIQSAEDADTNISISDPPFKFAIGESFVAMDADEAEEALKVHTQGLVKTLGVKQKELTALKKSLDAIKVQLSAKFGSSINLG